MNLADHENLDIPPLIDVGPHPPPAEASRFWKYLHRWRVVLFHRWKQAVGDVVGPAELGQSVDHLVGTSLLLRYVQSWRGPDVPSLKALCGGDHTVSALDLYAKIQTSFSCPILRSVFEASWRRRLFPFRPPYLSRDGSVASQMQFGYCSAITPFHSLSLATTINCALVCIMGQGCGGFPSWPSTCQQQDLRSPRFFAYRRFDDCMPQQCCGDCPRCLEDRALPPPGDA